MKFVTLTSALGLFGLLLLSPGARAQTTAFNVVNPGNAENLSIRIRLSDLPRRAT